MVQITEWGHVYVDNGILYLEVKSRNSTYTPLHHEALRYYRGIKKELLDKANRPSTFSDGMWFRLAYQFSV